ncbi:type IV pilus twitching motility protein PilT [Rhodohalobacter barkolensis]|uniref:Twitching motility protein PilT n=1 Tax=Rhodohalobacter barkolensis TaxID=2053187 RepID=A0A2N0VK76_9BACT|nr:ATPase, T2SS/T4P/T4SS family [Rhodohalobacter barkolensis]PKD44602.1 twitching motility protein PilT [Rhodohalobacter barkolensis]
MSTSISFKPIREICGKIVSQIPESKKGLEYHAAIGDMVNNLPEEERKTLRKSLNAFLVYMEKIEASDIDIGGHGCSGKIWYRVFGKKSPLKMEAELPIGETDVLLHNALTQTQRDQLLNKKSLDFSYTIETDGNRNRRYRANMYMDLEALALNMRKIDTEIRPFKTLGVHPEIAKALSLKYYKYGLTLVTGITGSGKSSTLDTIIDANNRTVDAHIVVIASPVELIHNPIRSVIRHREVGRDVTSFKDGAIQALRQDPDVIVIGELRDPETITTTLEITDSGHKTFGTLHTSSAMESIERILGEVPTEEQDRVRNRLADVLTCVISQKLVSSLDGKRVLAKEVLLVTPSIRAAIRNNNVNEIYQMLNEGSELGMNTMEQDLKRLYDEGRISKEEAFNNANNKKRIQQLFNELD